MTRKNRMLYYGDNLDVMRRHIKDESVDLIYLDPPFNSKATYNILFKSKDGNAAPAQIKAFDDTWHWDRAAAEQFYEVVTQGGEEASALTAFEELLGHNDMLAYLSMMAPRLVELRRVLKSTGSIYLHCDPTASHYLKILMDSVFGAKFFRNEIVWCYTSGGKSKKTYAKKHDVILFYSKSDNYYFDADSVRIPYSKKTLDNYKPGLKGSQYTADVKLNKKGKIPEDYWNISVASKSTKEYLGYPTQKPLKLLERIVAGSSKEGDVVLDPFCGCGTAIVAAEKLKRHWIGIDITHLAIGLMRHRIRDSFSKELDLTVVGEPVTLDDARELARSDKYQFQWWALGLVGARPNRDKQRKGADGGIDGALFFVDGSQKPKKIIISVKGGKNVGVSMVRDLIGTIDSNRAEIGVLISMAKPTKPMLKAAAGAGFYKTAHWGNFPRIQILTVEDLLDGKTIEYPGRGTHNVTFKKAKKVESTEQKGLWGHQK